MAMHGKVDEVEGMEEAEVVEVVKTLVDFG